MQNLFLAVNKCYPVFPCQMSIWLWEHGSIHTTINFKIAVNHNTKSTEVVCSEEVKQNKIMANMSQERNIFKLNHSHFKVNHKIHIRVIVPCGKTNVRIQVQMKAIN